MPHSHYESAFDEDYLDSAVEKMRECVREIAKIPGERERLDRCKDLLTSASKIFKELQGGYDKLLGEAQAMDEQLVEQGSLERTLEEVIERIHDLDRGILTLPELIAATEPMYR